MSYSVSSDRPLIVADVSAAKSGLVTNVTLCEEPVIAETVPDAPLDNAAHVTDSACEVETEKVIEAVFLPLDATPPSACVYQNQGLG